MECSSAWYTVYITRFMDFFFSLFIHLNKGHTRARKKKKRNPVNSWLTHAMPDIIIGDLVNSWGKSN